MKKIFTILLLILIFTVLGVLFFLGRNKPQDHIRSFPTPTLFKAQAPSGIDRVTSDDYSMDIKTKEIINKEHAVSELINIVPYKGGYFNLDYDFNSVSFLLKLDKSNAKMANKELSAFLSAHGIKDLSWFENIAISYY